MDIAFQCAPDHPWVEEHPQWVQVAPRRHGAVRRKPAQALRRHPCRSTSRLRIGENLWKELKSVFDYWIEQGVMIFRVDNPPHQSVSLLGMVYPGNPYRAPQCALPGRGLHTPPRDAAAGQGRLQPVVYLLYLAQYALRTAGVRGGANPRTDARVLSAQLLAQHARYPDAHAGVRRRARPPDAGDPGRDAVVELRSVRPGVRIQREHPVPGQGRVRRPPKSTRSSTGTGTPRRAPAK